MQKLVTKYGLAAHLAILAVAPLFLYSFFPQTIAAVAQLWLAGLGALWLVAAPSCRRGETLAAARSRVGRSVFRAPTFWSALLLAVFAGAALANGTLVRDYDWRTTSWCVAGRRVAGLPAAAEGFGIVLLATALSLGVAVVGTGRGLGRGARTAFLRIATVLSALLACALFLAHACGWTGGSVPWMPLDYGEASFAGVAFGLWLLAAVAAWQGLEPAERKAGLPLAALALAGNAAGLFLFAPPLEVALVLAAFLLLGASAALLARRTDGVGRLGTLAMLLSAPLALAALALGGPEGAGTRFAAIVGGGFPPADYWTARAALSGIAARIWQAAPAFGGGCGAFALHLPLVAARTDWAVLPAGQMAAINGWWHLLAEVGVCGLVLLAVPALDGACGWLRRLVATRGAFAWRPVHLLGPVVLALAAAIGCLDASLARADVLLACLTAIAISTRSMAFVKDPVERSVSNV